jgi:hypothetical protein
MVEQVSPQASTFLRTVVVVAVQVAQDNLHLMARLQVATAALVLSIHSQAQQRELT